MILNESVMKTVTKEQVIIRLKRENPWWEEPHEMPRVFKKLTPRPYLDLFYPLAKSRKVRRAVVLMGPRRVGKTVMIHHTIEKLLRDGIKPERICYVSVDHPIYNGLELESILDFYSETCGVDCREDECYVFFDEIQYLRNWEIYLKIVVDNYDRVKCVASGSAAAALKLKSNESGAGRFTDFLLPPLTFYEYLVLSGETKLAHTVAMDEIDTLNSHFLDYLNYGGYPEIVFSDEIKFDAGRYIRNDIIDKVLLRDLPSLYGIQDVQELNSLFTTLAYNSGHEVSLEALSQNSGVAKNTIKRYIEYLESAFLIRIVHRVDRDARRFKRASFFKVYLTNPSIRSALFSPITSDDEFMGALVETGVYAQLFHAEAPNNFYYARWKNGEVDLVELDYSGNIEKVVEIKWTDRYVKKTEGLKSLIDFCHARNQNTALVTTLREFEMKTYQNITLEFMPTSLYALMLGRNIIEKRRESVQTLREMQKAYISK